MRVNHSWFAVDLPTILIVTGGLTTKVHAICDGYGNPLKFMLTARNVNDSTVAEEMLSSFNLKNKYIYADKGYDTASIVRYIENQGGNAVIPSKCNAVNPRKTDWFLSRTGLFRNS